MNICALVPSEEHLAQAGVRIRYRRIGRELEALGHALDVLPIHKIGDRSELIHDVYLISKCYEASALVVARLLTESEKLVGVDLFDDYFSQIDDSRFTHLRYWLRTLLPLMDFALCSTPTMGELAARLVPKLAVHLMNDPAERLDAEEVRLSLRRKLEFAHRKRILQIGWFGIGDNPYFPVGLADLVAYGGKLACLRERGFDVQLSILTNLRSMTADGLAALKRLPVPYGLEEWTEDREALLLARSLVCFLPVNAQNFSIVKSLNRAVSALCAGAQVLSSGFPLYERLAPFIYDNPEKLLGDLERRSLALREDTLPALAHLMERCADAGVEAHSMAEFLEDRRRRKSHVIPLTMLEQPVAVIHGRNTLGNTHKFAQRLGALSVSSPFCSSELNFDVRFPFAADREGCDILIAERHCPSLDPTIQANLSPHGKILSTMYHRLDAGALPSTLQFDREAIARMGSAAAVAASYPSVMATIENALRRLFPGISCYYSEHAALPWAVHAS